MINNQQSIDHDGPVGPKSHGDVFQVEFYCPGFVVYGLGLRPNPQVGTTGNPLVNHHSLLVIMMNGAPLFIQSIQTCPNSHVSWWVISHVDWSNPFLPFIPTKTPPFPNNEVTVTTGLTWLENHHGNPRSCAHFYG